MIRAGFHVPYRARLRRSALSVASHFAVGKAGIGRVKRRENVPQLKMAVYV